MVEIGKYNTLKIIKDLDFGVYLDGERDGDTFAGPLCAKKCKTWR